MTQIIARVVSAFLVSAMFLSKRWSFLLHSLFQPVSAFEMASVRALDNMSQSLKGVFVSLSDLDHYTVDFVTRLTLVHPDRHLFGKMNAFVSWSRSIISSFCVSSSYPCFACFVLTAGTE